MKIIFLGKVDSDIYDKFRIARNYLEQEINNINFINSISDISEIRVLFIIHESGGIDKPVVKYIKKEKVVEIEYNIDYQTIKSADAKMLNLILKNELINVIYLFRNEKYLSTSKVNGLIEVIRKM